MVLSSKLGCAQLSHNFHITVWPVQKKGICTPTGEKLVTAFCLPTGRATTWRTITCLHHSFQCNIATSVLRLIESG